MNPNDIPQELREPEQIILPKNNEKIMTIEDLLGPENNYEAIIVDLKELCNNYKDFIFSDNAERGAHFSSMISKEQDHSKYYEANKKWVNIVYKYKIPIDKLNSLSKALYCKGEKQIAKQLDLGLTIYEQRNAEDYFKNITCPN